MNQRPRAPKARALAKLSYTPSNLSTRRIISRRPGPMQPASFKKKLRRAEVLVCDDGNYL